MKLSSALTIAIVAVQTQLRKTTSTEEHSGYTSSRYIKSTLAWHEEERGQRIFDVIEQYVDKRESVLDFGCATGVTGLTLLLGDYQDVAFTDFEEIGHHINSVTRRWGELFIPYGQEDKRKYDWVVALDVIEHVPNPLSLIRWLHKLSTYGVILTYPVIAGESCPYSELRVDEVVDTELLLPAINYLFSVPHYRFVDNGVELVLLHKNN